MEKCTFKPETNNIRRDMQSARLYVQTNIFDRLRSVCNGALFTWYFSIVLNDHIPYSSHPPRDNLSYSASSNDGSDDDGMIFSEGALKVMWNRVAVGIKWDLSGSPTFSKAIKQKKKRTPVNRPNFRKKSNFSNSWCDKKKHCKRKKTRSGESSQINLIPVIL